MGRCCYVYIAVITILCIIAGIISMEYDEGEYKKLISKLFKTHSANSSSEWQIDEHCNAVCVPKHLCVNDSVVVDGAGLFSLRMSNRIGAKAAADCGTQVPCCLSDDTDYDEDNEPDNPFENASNEAASPEKEKTPTMGCGYRYDRNINVISTRISSGANTHLGEFPWVVAIGLRYKGGDLFEYRGGGSLIHTRVILTAAHILQNKTAQHFLVRAGEWDMRNMNEEFKHQDRSVLLVVKHSRFDAATLHNDIALLILKQPFELTQTVNTICLPVLNFSPEHNTKCTVSGWGKDARNGRYQSILRKVEVPFVARQECKQILRGTRLGPFYRLHPSLVCAGGKSGKDASEGDGGSPLVCAVPTTEARFYQMGIVAGGKYNCLISEETKI